MLRTTTMEIKLRRILRAFYPSRVAAKGAKKNGASLSWRRFGLTLCLAAVLVKLALFLLYYNSFISMQYDVEEAAAQVDTQLQRRRNIILNLSVMVMNYAKHEKEIFGHVADTRKDMVQPPGPYRPRPHRVLGPRPSKPLPSRTAQQPETGGRQPPAADARPEADARTGPVPPRRAARDSDGDAGARAPLKAAAPKSGPASGTSVATRGNSQAPGAVGDLSSLLSKIFAIAERYPELRLSENFQHYMDALVEAETKIAEQRMTYNERANDMSTAVGKFPGFVFARIYGFESPSFFEPEAEARKPPKVAY